MLVKMAEIQRHMDALDSMLSMTVVHPEWFDAETLPAAQCWIEGEIAQLEDAQIAIMQEQRQLEQRWADKVIPFKSNKNGLLAIGR